jgi:glycosyltransferase involved in cell wall biosynthesis
MKIALIGPGEIEIPPKGWGATEILMWDMAQTLRKMGHKPLITNTKDYRVISETINDFKPDFVHHHHDQMTDVMKMLNCPNQAITSHYGYLDRPEKHAFFSPYPSYFQKFLQYDKNIFCLSNEAKAVYENAGFDKNRLFVTRNGVNQEKIEYSSTAEYPNKSVYLASLEYRKRQYALRDSKCDIDFVGVTKDNTVDYVRSKYIGTWQKDEVYKNLTKYANLVLLSDGEGHPLVCLEAMAAGLGLVLSEYSCQNLDKTKPFITIIPESKMNDINFIDSAIEQNKKVSVTMRDEIRKYVLDNFEWSVVMNDYVSLLERLIK